MRKSTALLGLIIAWALTAHTPALAQGGDPATPEQKTAQYFESIKAEPPALYIFLRQMPKGGDLHSHLTGAIYAESYVKWAAEAGLCVDQRTLLLSGTPCDEASGRPAASKSLMDNVLYRRMLDGWSMRNWHYSGQNGHDQFFDAFAKFGPAGNNRYGDMIAEVAARADSGRVSYLELMLTPDNGVSRNLGRKLKWTDDLTKMRPDEAARTLEKMRKELLALGMSQAVQEGRNTLDQMEKRKRELLKCDDREQAAAACKVTVRYIFQVARGGAPEEVFAQMVAAMEMANVEPRLVALNLVQAEDMLPALTNFAQQMIMLNYLRSLYQKGHVTLHAGELAPGLVPPGELRFHIRDSVQKARAERIGHGVDIAFEDDPIALLREMAQKNVMVEICLSSNDGILGVRGKNHPLSLYLEYGVPVALATDDEGVSRSDITREFMKAVEDQGLGYVQLKMMARASLEHAFIAGESLWKDARKSVPAQQCASDRPDQETLSRGCKQLLDGSEKARLQWGLEKSFAAFEKKY